jgi:hypothetical protein
MQLTCSAFALMPDCRTKEKQQATVIEAAATLSDPA